MIPVFLAFSSIAAVGIFVYLVTATPPKPVVENRSAKFLMEMKAEDGRPMHLLLQMSLYERVVARMLRRCVQAGRRLTPHHYVEVCAMKLRHAGRRGPEELDRFLAIRLVTAVAGVVLLFLTSLISKGVFLVPLLNERISLALFGFLTLLVVIGPDASLNRAASARREVVQSDLPDVLDLLTISVEAGVGFEQAIQHVTEMMEGPLSDEFTRMNAEMRAGASRSEALRALEERVGVEDVKSFIMAILQADKFGVSIARILRAQSDEMRTKRRQRAQETAQKAPVKMLVPITLFIFPPLFIVLLGPAMLNIAVGLK
jgi:tight adherence protein C